MALSPPIVHACGCGPGWANYLLPFDNDEINVLRMPEAFYRYELTRFLTPTDDERTPYDPGADRTESINATRWKSTLDCDTRQVAAYIQGKYSEGNDRIRLIDQYSDFRTASRPTWLNQTYEDRISLSQNHNGPMDPEKNIAAHQEVLNIIPSEYRLYAIGAAYFYEGDLPSATAKWQELLTLPEDQRKYRSTWTAFMLGKALSKKDPTTAMQSFEQLHAMVKAGLDDPLDLESESITWEIEAQFGAGNPVEAFHRYADLYEHGSRMQRHIAFVEMRQKSFDCLKSSELSDKAATDTLSRQIIGAALVSESKPNFYDAFDKSQLETWATSLERTKGKSLEGADRFAWAAYDRGEFSLARRFVEMCDKSWPYAQWIGAKLDIRGGKVNQSIATLRSARKTFSGENSWRWCDVWIDAVRDSSSEMGALLLAQSEYADAMNAFLWGDDWEAAAYVAERVLTMRELETLITNKKLGNEMGVKPEKQRSIDYLFAKRCMREGRWNKAKQYMTGEYKSQVETLETLIAAKPSRIKVPASAQASYMENPYGLHDPRCPRGTVDRELAENKIKAAAIVRDDGMELMGTESWPDNAANEGLWPASPVALLRAKPANGLDKKEAYGFTTWNRLPENVRASIWSSQDERARLARTEPDVKERFHYRYKAANLLWQAAALLPDNDDQLMDVLWTGGSYIKAQDPQAANRFYRALVLRNRKMPYAQEADRIHWFPKDPP